MLKGRKKMKEKNLKEVLFGRKQRERMKLCSKIFLEERKFDEKQIALGPASLRYAGL